MGYTHYCSISELVRGKARNGPSNFCPAHSYPSIEGADASKTERFREFRVALGY